MREYTPYLIETRIVSEARKPKATGLFCCPPILQARPVRAFLRAQSMNLTEHFSLDELCHTDTGLLNTPDDAVEINLAKLAGFLEWVRIHLGRNPIIINSAYRSEAVNAAVGGAHNSAHTRGLAADFTCPEFGTPAQICLVLIDSGLAFDQLILEKTWVHVAIGGASRGQVLTCVAPGKYIPGLHKEAMA